MHSMRISIVLEINKSVYGAITSPYSNTSAHAAKNLESINASKVPPKINAKNFPNIFKKSFVLFSKKCFVKTGTSGANNVVAANCTTIVGDDTEP